MQSLWRFYVEWYGADRDPKPPSGYRPGALWRKGPDLTGFTSVRMASKCHGTLLTLNGIAQGHITDRGVAILKRSGLYACSADLGEIGAIDRAQPAIRGELPDRTERQSVCRTLRSTSAGSGTRLADNGDHHIFDPISLRPARIWKWVSVHPSATFAQTARPPDSTVFLRRMRPRTRGFPGARLWVRWRMGEPPNCPPDSWVVICQGGRPSTA